MILRDRTWIFGVKSRKYKSEIKFEIRVEIVKFEMLGYYKKLGLGI